LPNTLPPTLNSSDENLGWYEDDVSKSLELLNNIPKINNSKIFLAGVGTSLLIEELLQKDCLLILNDISIEAINKIKNRITKYKNNLSYLCQDISSKIENINDVDIWIDRAVLHFLRDENDINNYFNNLKSVLKKDNSYVMFAQFSKDGAPKCAGLDLHRYDLEELSKRLGSSFELIYSFEYTYINPSNQQRPYIYALYKRLSN